MAAYDFPDTAGRPSDGSFTYTAPDGTIYEWNGYAWQVPDSGNPGGGGGGNFEIPTQALPPSGAADGDMFWCTDDGRLYIYYEDADTSQWVDASPDNTSEAVDSYWEKSGSTLSPIDTADSVDIGSGSIVLNASGTASVVEAFATSNVRVERTYTGSGTTQARIQIGGSDTNALQVRPDKDVVSNCFEVDYTGKAKFKGTVQTTDINVTSADSNGWQLGAGGTIVAQRKDSANNPVFRGFYQNKENFYVKASGVAYFANKVQIQDLATGDGLTAAAGFLTVRNDDPFQKPIRVFRDGTTDPGNLQASIGANGTGYFRGNVTSNGNVLTRNVELHLEADDPTKYTATTDADGNQSLVYNGAVLDIKERIQNVISRMDAIEANEVTDDATDSALLTLVASLSSRLDERDATIAALTTRITTLEIQSNGGN